MYLALLTAKIHPKIPPVYQRTWARWAKRSHAALRVRKGFWSQWPTADWPWNRGMKPFQKATFWNPSFFLGAGGWEGCSKTCPQFHQRYIRHIALSWAPRCATFFFWRVLHKAKWHPLNPSKIEWYLTNGPLWKLRSSYEILRFRGPFSGSCWRFLGLNENDMVFF